MLQLLTTITTVHTADMKTSFFVAAALPFFLYSAEALCWEWVSPAASSGVSVSAILSLSLLPSYLRASLLEGHLSLSLALSRCVLSLPPSVLICLAARASLIFCTGTFIAVVRGKEDNKFDSTSARGTSLGKHV